MAKRKNAVRRASRRSGGEIFAPAAGGGLAPESHSLLEAVVEGTSDAVYVKDAKGRYLLFNAAAARATGRRAEAVLGNDDTFLFAAEEARKVMEGDRAVITAGKTMTYEEIVTTAGGERTTYLSTKGPVFDSRHEVVGLFGIARDITARKRLEEALQESEQKFRAIFDQATNGIALGALDGRCLAANKAACDFIGVSEAEVCRLTIQDIVHPDDWHLTAELLPRLIAGEIPFYTVERRYVRRDGTVVWGRASASLVRDTAGNPKYLIGVMADITERKRAEAELAILAQAVQTTTEPICITDLQDRFTFVNRAFQSTYGYRETEVLGKAPGVIFSPRNPPALLGEILAQTRHGGWRGEVLNRRKDGTDFPILLSTSQIKDQTGRVIGLMGVARDVSEEKRLEKQRSALSQLGYRLSAAVAPGQAANIILEIAADLFGWDAAYFHLYSEAKDQIIFCLTIDTVDGQRLAVPGTSFSPEPSPLMRLVMRAGARLIDRAKEPSVALGLVPFGNTQRRSACMMYAPIRSEGDVIGILSVQSYTPSAYSPHDLALLQTLADHSGDALQRIKVADAFRETEAKYRGMFENASEGIFQTTPEGRYLSANPALARMFGYESPAELMSSVDDIGQQTYVLPQKRTELKQLLEGQGAVQGFEAQRRRKDGSTFWISVNGHAVRDASGAVRYYEGTNQDISRIIEAREALARSREELERLVRERTGQLEAANQSLRGEMEDRKRLEREVLEKIEREQQRIGQDLHDGLCQLLTGIKFKAAWLQAELGKKGLAEASEARALEQWVNQAIRQGYGLARGLNPVKLPVHGLTNALAELAAGFEAAFDLRCACEFTAPVVISDQTVANHLYRIAQEAIHNAIKHGKARQITIGLKEQAGCVGLTVKDDGVGFRPRGDSKVGMGLHNMRARAGMIGASLEIGAREGGGTVVACWLPVGAGPNPGG